MALEHFLTTNDTVIHVRISQVRGSSPREVGAQMFVAAHGIFGTIGGGQLEYMAIDKARAMLRAGRRCEDMDVPLGPEIGQCCGGRVALTLTQMNAPDKHTACALATADHAQRPHVYILGAGHVGRALTRLFQFMPVRCVLIDGRHEELFLCDADVETRLSAMPEADIRNAPAGSAYIVLTHDHALDFLLTTEALNRGDASYVGLIGSATKRAKFARFHASNAPDPDTGALVCPIGASASQDKRPEVIAASVVAEVMTRLTSAPSHKETRPAEHQIQ